jgi:hypothetical protein
MILMYRNILGKKHMQMMCHMPFWLVCLFMVYNVTFNNISDTGGPGENHRPVASHWQTLSHNVESSTPRHERKKIFTLTLRQPYGVTNTPQRRYDKKEHRRRIIRHHPKSHQTDGSEIQQCSE